MKKIQRNKLVALLLSAGMTASLLAACSIDTGELSQGINDLGNAFTEQTETVETEVTESGETEASPLHLPAPAYQRRPAYFCFPD